MGLSGYSGVEFEPECSCDKTHAKGISFRLGSAFDSQPTYIDFRA